MKSQVILCFTLLLVSTCATSMLDKYSFAFKSRRSIMQVMAQVESTLKSGGPMDAITKILADFEDEIKQEQVDHQELFDRQTAECDSEIEFRRVAVREANDAIHEAANTLESCQGQQQRAESDLKQAENQLTNARLHLGKLTRKKIEWDYHYETFTHATKMALDAFPECYRLLDELENGSAQLVQLTSHVTKMVPHVSRARAMQNMNEVMSVLAQMTTSYDKVAIDKVRNVLMNFEEQIKEKQEKAAEENEKLQAFFVETEKKLKAEIERLIQLIEDLKVEIHTLGQCISVQQANLHSANEKLRRNSSLLEKAEDMCNSMREQFVKASAARKDELELLAAIKIKVEERYAQISKGATKRGEMTAEQLGEYDELEYEHDSFEHEKK